MGEPRQTYKNPVRGALMEILSGISSLHMPPKPVEFTSDDINFLAYTDENVKHGLEHLNRAVELLFHNLEQS